MTEKSASEKMMDLDAKEVMSAVKTMIALVFEIDSGGIHTAMISMRQDTMVQHQIIVLGSKIRYLGTVVFPLVLCLVDVIADEQQPWIPYHKIWQLG